MNTVDFLFSSYKALGEQKVRHPELFIGSPNDMKQSSPEKDWFRIFDDMQGIDPVAVIVGQDPYPQPNTATGIAFANFKKVGNLENTPLSPSLRVIRDSVLSFTRGGYFDETLMYWVKQGIMPINAAWTVGYNKPMSHTLYWIGYTGSFLRELSSIREDLCYILLGNVAQQLRPNIISGTIITGYHPSYYVRKKEQMPARLWEELVNNVKLKQGKELKLTYGED